ncbi:MAG: suppressor of fused domain protein [Jatrophihabitantaceae bacterium]
MTSPADPLASVEAAYLDHFPVIPTRASVTFVGVEPIEVLRFVLPAGSVSDVGIHYVSLGMSRYPMVEASASTIDEHHAPRAELVISLHDGSDSIWRTLAVLAAAPAVESAVYAPGGRLHLPDGWAPGSRCAGAVLTTGPLAPISLSSGSDVQLLRLLPATATELAWAKVHGSDALIERWTMAGVDLADLWRDPVDLVNR